MFRSKILTPLPVAAPHSIMAFKVMNDMRRDELNRMTCGWQLWLHRCPAAGGLEDLE